MSESWWLVSGSGSVTVIALRALMHFPSESCNKVRKEAVHKAIQCCLSLLPNQLATLSYSAILVGDL